MLTRTGTMRTAGAGLCLLLAAVGSAAQSLHEGSSCYNQAADNEGVCTQLKACQWAQNEIKMHRYPQICSWAGTLPVVCCPAGSLIRPTTRRPLSSGSGSGTGSSGHPSSAGISGSGSGSSRPTGRPTGRPTPTPTRPSPTVNTGGRIARRKCQDYAQFVFREDESYALSPLAGGERINQCAAPADALVVGGEEALPREFPHMTLIGYGDRDEIDYQCGGSLISPNFVLTAAHCLVNPARLEARWALLGELDRSTDADDAQPQLIEVQRSYRHPDYQPPQHYSDIALLKLSRAADLNGYVRPACLYTEKNIEDPRSPMATGWGHTEWAGDPSDKLMKVSLKVQPYRVCNESYRSNVGRQLPRGILDHEQLCAGVLEGGKDTCQGDSGGPLQLFSSENPYCMHYIIGVTSFGKACGFRNSPAVYSRVSNFVPWIEGIVWPNH